MDDQRKFELLSLAKQGDRDAQCELFDQFVYLAKSAVTEFVRRHPRTEIYKDDLHSEALLTLYRSIPTFDESRGRSLTGHYFQMIRYGLLDYTKNYLHNGIRLPAYVQKRRSVGEVQIPVEHWEDDALCSVPDSRVYRESSLRSLSSRQRAHIMSLAKSALSPEQWQIAQHYFGFDHRKPKTLEAVARMFGLSDRDLQRTLNEIIRRLHSKSQKKCRQCGGKFHGKEGVLYCSRLCRDRYGLKKRTEEQKFVYTCDTCGNHFAKDRRSRGVNYCSIPCANVGRRKKLCGKADQPVIELVCQHSSCSNIFYKRKRGENKYCSASCRDEAQGRTDKMATCANRECGGKFRPYRNSRNGVSMSQKYCSVACAGASRSQRAEDRLANRRRLLGTLQVSSS